MVKACYRGELKSRNGAGLGTLAPCARRSVPGRFAEPSVDLNGISRPRAEWKTDRLGQPSSAPIAVSACPLDAELFHPRLQRGALHAKPDRSAGWAADHPIGLRQHPHDMLALGVFESG